MHAMPHVKDVDTNDFMAAVVERSKQIPVVVDFWATWCEPCKQLSPVLERLAAEYQGAWELAKVDVDANQQLSGHMGVQSIPTVVAFVGGRPVAQFSGAQPEAQVREWLAGFVAPPGDARMAEIEALLDAGAEQAAETKLLAILAEEPANDEAATTLAALYIDQGRQDEVGPILDTLPPSTEVDRLRAAASLTGAIGNLADLQARLAADPSDTAAKIDVARGLAAAGHVDPALEDLLAIIGDRDEHADAARSAMIEVFNVLGNDHPSVPVFRRRLANLLF